MRRNRQLDAIKAFIKHGPLFVNQLEEIMDLDGNEIRQTLHLLNRKELVRGKLVKKCGGRKVYDLAWGDRPPPLPGE